MSDTHFEDLLEQTMGLNAASIGASAIRRAVDTRMRSCNLAEEHVYWDFLKHSPEELQELIEAVIVPETWFFRDPQAFAALARLAGAQHRDDVSRPLRLLSLPCSSGEEPCTMAMTLLDAGVPADGFGIDAVDISARSLAQARTGVYGRNSFRSRDLPFRDRHFEAVERGHRISDAVRAQVNFICGNILDADFLAGAESYDFIFCRNLLIYFDVPNQNRAVTVLKRLLAPQGTLFIGHSETGLLPPNGFASAKIPMAFAFRPAPKQPRSPRVPLALPPAGAKPSPQSALPTRAKALPASAVTREAAPAAIAPAIEDLRRVADCGRLDDAARGCETHMRESGPSPEALLLLALISDASGDSFAAANYYRKVLYLEPGNAEALSHLALLRRKQGDLAGAKLLDDRLQRQAEERTR